VTHEPGDPQPGRSFHAGFDSGSEEEQQRRDSPDRVVALTDGVFAIIITILVLEILVPSNLPEQSLREAVEELEPTLVAWVISFLLTGMYWVSHRDLFAKLRVVNRDLVWLNLLFLLPTGLIPFAASVLGEYPDEAIALHLYGVVMIAVTAMRVVLYSYVLRRPELTWTGKTEASSRIGLAIAAAPVPIYVVAIAVASVSPLSSVLLFLSVPGLYFLLVTLLRDRPGTRVDADEFS
jgi:uncharacterized membrane protein